MGLGVLMCIIAGGIYCTHAPAADRIDIRYQRLYFRFIPQFRTLRHHPAWPGDSATRTLLHEELYSVGEKIRSRLLEKEKSYPYTCVRDSARATMYATMYADSFVFFMDTLRVYYRTRVVMRSTADTVHFITPVATATRIYQEGFIPVIRRMVRDFPYQAYVTHFLP
jgi:hypothetical protein